MRPRIQHRKPSHVLYRHDHLIRTIRPGSRAKKINTNDPATLPARLEAAGFSNVNVTLSPRRVHFTARKPPETGA